MITTQFTEEELKVARDVTLELYAEKDTITDEDVVATSEDTHYATYAGAKQDALDALLDKIYTTSFESFAKHMCDAGNVLHDGVAWDVALVEDYDKHGDYSYSRLELVDPESLEQLDIHKDDYVFRDGGNVMYAIKHDDVCNETRMEFKLTTT